MRSACGLSIVALAYLQVNMSASLMAEFADAAAQVPLHLQLAGTAD